MSLTPTTRRRGVRVFLDYRDFISKLGNSAPDPCRDSNLLGPALAEAALKIVDPTAVIDYKGFHVYVGGGDTDDEWVHHVSNQTGTFVTTVRRSGPSRSDLPKSETDRGSRPDLDAGAECRTDDGLYVRLAVDLMQFASLDDRGIGVLASSNCALIPVAEALECAGSKLVHAVFPPMAGELSRKCWASFPIPEVLRGFRRTDRERTT